MMSDEGGSERAEGGVAVRTTLKAILPLLLLWPVDGVMAQTTSAPNGTAFQFAVKGDASSPSGVADKEKDKSAAPAAPESKASSALSPQGTFISSTTGRKNQATEPPVSKDPQVRPK
jgi:hypothetical protein